MPDPPSHPEDARLVDALRARRPEAVGQVYNVHGPPLIGYADALLGDRDAAVEAVRAALLRAGAAPRAVPEAGELREWLHDLVRRESLERVLGGAPPPPPPPPVAPVDAPTLADLAGPGPEPPHPGPARRGRRRLGLVGAAAAAALVTCAAFLLLFDASAPRRPPAGDRALTPPTPVVTTPAPSPTATASPSASLAPKPSAIPSKRPGRPRDERRRAPRGRLAVGDAGCRGIGVAGLPRTCRITLTARGGPVRWSVSSVSGRVSASGGGRLGGGDSASVRVTVWPSVRCYVGGRGSGAVRFSPGGTARISYTCWRR
ncbi:hypothetical protein [Actinomadura kijaniata]|uniref:hypothetical protein n=1 Tax=Actinomadura kijaniata TaxID=46161 RepID=UPI00082DAEBD|nr:hypothetical protein [Actinomadura kijaniata]